MTAPIFSEPADRPPPLAALHDGRTDFNLVFIHSRLDDYGLSPQQFRVYAHLARRAGSGAAWPAVATIAANCQLHPKTVRRALRVLVKHRLIRREDRPGDTALYRLTPASEWNPPRHITDAPGQKDTPASFGEDTSTKRIADHPYQKDGAEGNPIEGNPVKAISGPHNPPSGESMSDKPGLASQQAAEIYAAYPKKVGKPTALRAIRRAIQRHKFEIVLERTLLYARTYNGPPEFIPNPSTFFNQARFNDDPATWRRAAQPGRPGGFVPPRKFDSANYQQPVETF